jgi:transposase
LKETSSFNDKVKTGRPKKRTVEIENQVVAWTKEDRRHTSAKLSKMVQERFGVSIIESNVRTFLKITMAKFPDKFSWSGGSYQTSLE